MAKHPPPLRPTHTAAGQRCLPSPPVTDTFFGMQERKLVNREISHSAHQGACGGTDSVAVADPNPNPHPAKPTSASRPSLLHPQQP
jgi:hypothetical protein